MNPPTLLVQCNRHHIAKGISQKCLLAAGSRTLLIESQPLLFSSTDLCQIVSTMLSRNSFLGSWSVQLLQNVLNTIVYGFKGSEHSSQAHTLQYQDIHIEMTTQSVAILFWPILTRLHVLCKIRQATYFKDCYERNKISLFI